GIAKAAFATGDVTTTGKILGTVAYLSPEQAAGQEPSAASDLYALGIVMYEMLVGRPPFPRSGGVATAIGHLRDDPPPLRSIRAGIPRSLDAAVMKALAKDPSDRFASAQEMHDALLEGVGGRTAVTPRVSGPAPAERDETVVIERQPFLRSEGRHIAPVVMLVVGAIVVAIAVAALIGTASDDPDDAGGAGTQTSSGDDAGGAIRPVTASDFDPEGGDGEHPELVADAFDGNASTSWHTQDYSTAISTQKEGVGLTFDLGETRDVAAVEILFDRPGYSVELRAANDQGASQDDYELVDSTTSADEETRFDIEHGARHWLVWITDLPGGEAGTGYIAEVRFLGP
ncbi:MAG: protein kinase domain-containing protein, partial [Actinomycetota bacterium]